MPRVYYLSEENKNAACLWHGLIKTCNAFKGSNYEVNCSEMKCNLAIQIICSYFLFGNTTGQGPVSAPVKSNYTANQHMCDKTVFHPVQ